MTGFESVLRLCKTGVPREWITLEQAATLYAKDQVIWSLGDVPRVLRGGTRLGVRSSISVAPIIASAGRVVADDFTPSFSAELLFRRDQFMCLYCGVFLRRSECTIDHIVPRSRGGSVEAWSNLATCCRQCNAKKSDKFLHEIGWSLLAVPFAPNRFEWFYLAGRKIHADQMDYLRPRFASIKMAA